MSSPAESPRPVRPRDLAVMRAPQSWSRWPFLPVVRPARAGGEAQLGVLYDARGVSGTYGYSATVFCVNVFLLPPTEEALFASPKCVYDTMEELAQDGWTVD